MTAPLKVVGATGITPKKMILIGTDRAVVQAQLELDLPLITPQAVRRVSVHYTKLTSNLSIDLFSLDISEPIMLTISFC